MPPAMQQQASTQLADGVPFVSTTQLETALTDQGITGDAAQAIVDVNASARLDALRVAFARPARRRRVVRHRPPPDRAVGDPAV